MSHGPMPRPLHRPQVESSEATANPHPSQTIISDACGPRSELCAE